MQWQKLELLEAGVTEGEEDLCCAHDWQAEPWWGCAISLGSE